MKKNNITSPIITTLLLVWIACTPSVDKTPPDGKHNSNTYAIGFQLESHPDYTLARVYNPWQGAGDIAYTYLLVPRGNTVPDSIQADAIVYTPVRSIVCMSTTHIGFLDALGELSSIQGVSGGQYVYNAQLQQGIEDKTIVDVGSDQQMNYETILQLAPDVVMLYGIGSEVAVSVDKFASLGVPAVINAEYIEKSPLAKAEWIRFVAALYGKETLADSIFMQIAANYQNLSAKVSSISDKPSVLVNAPWKGTWYVHGGQSVAAQFIKDAGGHYAFEELESEVSVPLGIETVLTTAADAEFWINCGIASSLGELKQSDSRIDLFQAFAKGQVYNNNRRVGAGGGIDYWESGIANPDKILADLIAILHPDSLPNHMFMYYQKLE